MAVRNSELAAQLALANTKRQALDKELTAKSKRLFELEKVVASLGAAERIVKDKGAQGTSIETCTEGEDPKGRLCLKVEAARSLSSDFKHGLKQGSGEVKVPKNSEAPGLVAIAGAVAAVWVFALLMEKRKALFS